MMMKKFLLTVFFACFVILSNGKQVNLIGPNADLTSVKLTDIFRNVPVEADFYNECCDEMVHVNGTAMFIFSDNVIRVVVKGLTGTGASTNYAYTSKGTSIENIIKPSDPDNGTYVLNVNMSNENGCSFKLKMHFHLTTNANGDVTATVDKVEIQCEK